MNFIAVGIGENKNIVTAIENYNNDEIKFIMIDNDEELVDTILNPKIDAVVRGSLPASNVMKQLKSKFPNNSISRATFIHDNQNEFLLSPVGIDEGGNIERNLEIAINCGKFIKKLSKEPKIAVLCDGRKGDYGRSPKISKSIEDSEELTRLIKEKSDFDVKNYYILIEQAIKDKCNIIIAPDGIFGNILFRTLVLVNNWPSYGAITFGLEKIYIDTSRDQTVEGYLRSLELASKLIDYNK